MISSLELAKSFLGKEIVVKIDRPLGSKHPKHDFVYQVNYGFIPNVKAPDGEELDAYYLGTDKPVNEATGKCVAIIHRLNDDDSKLVVISPDKENISDEEIEKSVKFQEQWFEHQIIREEIPDKPE